MKQIDVLYLEKLKEKLFIAFMMFVCEAIAKFPVLEELFPRFVEKVKAAYDHMNLIYLKYDVDECSKAVKIADEERSAAFTKMRNAIRSFILYQVEAAKTLAAETLLEVIELYGGAGIASQGINAKTTSIVNLLEDLEDKYPVQIETLGIGNLVAELKQAQQTFDEKYMARAECESQHSKGAMAEARKSMTKAYRDFVTVVNLEAEDDKEGTLSPFINLMNTEIGKFRTYAGQGQVGTTGSGSSTDNGTTDSGTGGGSVYKNATFEYNNGNSQKFRIEVGAPLEALPNTEGFIWKPEVPETMPNRNIIFREVPIEAEKATATFHFADHTEEEIKQAVGTALEAPENTAGYVWDPEVPAVMPAEDTSYYEQPEEDEGTILPPGPTEWDDEL